MNIKRKWKNTGRWKWLFWLCFLLLGIAGTNSRAAEPQMRALIITRGDYTGTYHDLSPGVENDGENIRRMLVNAYGDDGVSVTVKKSVKTADALKSAVQKAFADAQAEDINYFYYSGHGIATGLYLEIGEEAVTAEMLLDCFEGISGTNVLILDCCYAGIFTVASQDTQQFVSRTVSQSAEQSENQSADQSADESADQFLDDFVGDFASALADRPQTRSVLNQSRFRLLLGASDEELANQIVGDEELASVGMFTSAVTYGSGILPLKVEETQEVEEYCLNQTPANFDQDGEISYNEIQRFVQNHCTANHMRMYPADNEECFLPDKNGGSVVTFEKAQAIRQEDGTYCVEVSYCASKAAAIDVACYEGEDSWGIQQLLLSAANASSFPVYSSETEDGGTPQLYKCGERNGISVKQGYGTFQFSFPAEDEQINDGRLYACLIRGEGNDYLYMMPFSLPAEETKILDKGQILADDVYAVSGEELEIRADFGQCTAEMDTGILVSCRILDEDGNTVRVLGEKESLELVRVDASSAKFNCYRSFFWNGREDDGTCVKNGVYTVSVLAESASDSVTFEKQVTVGKSMDISVTRVQKDAPAEIQVTAADSGLEGSMVYLQKGTDESSRILLGTCARDEDGVIKALAELTFAEGGWYDLYIVKGSGETEETEILQNVLKVYEIQKIENISLSAAALDHVTVKEISCSFETNNDRTAVTVRVMKKTDDGTETQAAVLMEERRLAVGVHTVVWDGSAADGSMALPGEYYFAIAAAESKENTVVGSSDIFQMEEFLENTGQDSDGGTGEDGNGASGEETEQAAESVKIIVNGKTVKKLVIGRKEKVKLQAVVAPENTSDKTVTWVSSRPKVVSVGKNGKLKGKKPGKAVITVKTANGVSCKIKVIVKKAPKKLSLNVTEKTLKKGSGFRIRVKLPAKTASFKRKFTSSNPEVASVNKKGKVTAHKKGRTTITVRLYNGKKAKIKLWVR